MSKIFNIVIFASGNGTNVENIIKSFNNHGSIKIKLVLTNNKDAFVIQRCEKLNTQSHVFNYNELNSDDMLNKLDSINIDLIVLAGFLLLIPEKIIGGIPVILSDENGPITTTISPPPINIKIHMAKIKL